MAHLAVFQLFASGKWKKFFLVLLGLAVGIFLGTYLCAIWWALIKENIPMGVYLTALVIVAFCGGVIEIKRKKT